MSRDVESPGSHRMGSAVPAAFGRLFAKTLVALVLTSFFIADSVFAQDNEDKFGLFTRCDPVALFVRSLDSEDEAIITTDSIINVAESRLRSARIYSGEAVEYLYIGVTIVGSAFSITTTFNKWLLDEPNGFRGTGTTWVKSIVGTHRGDGGFIFSLLSRQLDEFIVEFLRVNAEAC